MLRTKRSFIRLTRWASVVATIMAGVFLSASARASVVYAVTADNKLLQFKSTSPGTIDRTVSLSGLDMTEGVLGVSIRPATGELYGLGSLGQVYRINPLTGQASAVGGPLDPATVPLSGSRFGFDFNPTVDRIRVVSDLAENYRLNPNDGTLTAVDGKLAYASGDTNFGKPPGVTAVAYTNGNNPKALTTTLYGLDTEFNALVTINPANSGILSTVGSLKQDDPPLYAGFDILDGQAVAATTAEPAFGDLPALQARLFGIDLATGTATALGVIGNGSYSINGIATTNASAVPLPPALLAAPAGFALVALARRRMLKRSPAL